MTPGPALDPTGGPTTSDRVPVVLASASPRRLDLLRRLGVDPDVRPADIDESILDGEDGASYVRRLAVAKAAAIDAPGRLVIAADTSVLVDHEILGKPSTPADAAAMLRLLSGRTHQVATAVAVVHDSARADVVVTTDVTFRVLDEYEIDWYVATGEPFDKAGGYGMQTAGGVLVSGIRGSDSNVIGLPLAETVALARSVGVELLR